MTSQYRFAFRCSYRLYTSWQVYGDGQSYEVETTREGPAWLVDSCREVWNGSAADFDREVIGATNTLHKYASWEPISDDVVAAFNAWRAAEHARQIAELDANPARYGVIAADDPIRLAPPVLTGARYVGGIGWVRNGAEAIAA